MTFRYLACQQALHLEDTLYREKYTREWYARVDAPCGFSHHARRKGELARRLFVTDLLTLFHRKQLKFTILSFKASLLISILQAPVVQRVDIGIHGINLYPVDHAIGFPNTYPQDSDSSDG